MGAESFPRLMMTAGLVAGLLSGVSVRAEDLMTIRGRATFKGDPAKFDPRPIEAVRGTQCDNGWDILDKSVLVNKKTSPPTLRNVMVWLVDGPSRCAGSGARSSC